MLRKLFRRGQSGPRKPPPFVSDLIDALSASGFTAALAPPDDPHHALGQPDGARSRGLIQIANRPPDLISCTSVGVGEGHLSQGESTGFHWLIAPHRIAAPWLSARVDAQRDFSARDVGPTRRFRWTPLDDDDASRAAAATLQERGGELALNDSVLRLLQKPELLSLQLKPDLDGWLRWTLYLGYERALSSDEIATLHGLCRLIATPDSGSAAPAS